ncbi:hypothetical protein [Marinobacter xestospongiae]|uniref:hypothetical protein n=1 Tax=Marinobacter xestospongiae TaxID=994319 RepID=UPI0020065976|nr:hypothetical protein [Marinobacter xestospongiae]MCK7566707.1 hypothetical protein [Marinobacter xestospongiae]
MTGLILPSVSYSSRFIGEGELQGSVLGRNDRPLQRWVYLFRQRKPDTKREVPREFVAATESDAATGEFVFRYLDESLIYTVISHDAEGKFDPVMKTGLRTTPMERL